MLVPNSEAWLAQLAKIDPKQAAATRELIKAAGKAEICSLCGDPPAGDFTLPTKPLIMRLCKECHMIATFDV